MKNKFYRSKSIEKAKNARRESREIREELSVPTLIKAVRMKCLECVSGSTKQVKYCNFSACYLWPYRLGRMPLRNDFQVPECDSHGQIISYRPYKGFKEETGK